MRKVLSGKALLFASLLLWVFMVRMMTGCSMGKDDTDKVRDLEYSVVGQTEVPEELQKIIEEKKKTPFKLTYSNDQNLYIVVGYGEQSTGGYSIPVKELYLTDNSIVIDTELMGPEKGETPGAEASFPYVVVMTEFLENPVVFQ